jgi:hypothetical protein
MIKLENYFILQNQLASVEKATAFLKAWLQSSNLHLYKDIAENYNNIKMSLFLYLGLWQ